ncbi:hypothetical protein CG709_11995, partial [Lachnotalea glycerini]
MATGLGSIMPEEGMKALTQIVAHPDMDHIAVIKAEEALLKKSGIETKKAKVQRVSVKIAPKHSAIKEDALPRIKEKIMESCGDILKVDKNEVDSDIPFSEYGVDSITGME